MNTLTNEIYSAFKTLMSTVFNQKNVTKNNMGFVTGLMVSAGLVLYGILNIFMPGVLAVLLIFSATAFMGYRTLTSNEDMPWESRETL